MRCAAILFCWMLAGSATPAQDEVLTIEELLEEGKALADELLERNQTGLEVDPEAISQTLRLIQEHFQGEYLIELGTLKRTAQQLLPWLESVPGFSGEAAWLRTRLDYFEVSERIHLLVGRAKPTPTPMPEEAAQRKIWRSVMVEKAEPAEAREYLPRLRDLFTTAQVPAQLVWLAEVESSFRPGAMSPAGAAGLFQLMPGTARALGLSLSPEDERLVPEKNAAAAARHLRYLYGRFRDWPLSLAAYNAGETRVARLLSQHSESTFGGIARYLPAETQLYVPKVDAVLWRREGLGLAQLPSVRK